MLDSSVVCCSIHAYRVVTSWLVPTLPSTLPQLTTLKLSDTMCSKFRREFVFWPSSHRRGRSGYITYRGHVRSCYIPLPPSCYILCPSSCYTYHGHILSCHYILRTQSFYMQLPFSCYLWYTKLLQIMDTKLLQPMATKLLHELTHCLPLEV